MQVTGKPLGATFSGVLSEGVSAFWKGIVFAYGREVSYTSIKLGAYAPVRDMLGAGSPDASVLLKFFAGALTGGTGSVVGNPFDVLVSRFLPIVSRILCRRNESEQASLRKRACAAMLRG